MRHNKLSLFIIILIHVFFTITWRPTKHIRQQAFARRAKG